ncbi:MAG: DUF523 domain-containing protein [Clostridia bacterium]|nr:DUF523 domain-containing protein [Clostridia bacterium]
METKEKVLVSACLLGQCCAYDGQHRKSEAVLRLAERYELIPICPEREGGLPTPRVPSERISSRVCSRDGADVTAAYERGALEALSLALSSKVAFAVLKSKSPSCGKGEIYDGSFTHRLIPGNGVTAELLLSQSIPVYTEKEIE